MEKNDQGMNQQYSGQQQYDANQQYSGQQQYDANQQYNGQQQYDANQQYSGQQQYDANQQYNGQQQYDANQQYSGQQQYDANQQYSQQQYDANQQYSGQQQYDANQQYSQQQYDANQQYSGQQQYDVNQQYGQQYYANQQYGQQYDQNQQYSQPQYDANQQYGQQYDQNQQYSQPQYDANQQYSGQQYDANQHYSGQPQYDANQQYSGQQYDVNQQYSNQRYDANQQYSGQPQYDANQQYGGQQQYDADQQYGELGGQSEGQKSEALQSTSGDTSEGQESEAFQRQPMGQEPSAQSYPAEPNGDQQYNGQMNGEKLNNGMQYNQPADYGQPAFSESETVNEKKSDSSGGGPKKPINKGLLIGIIAGAAVLVAAVLLIFVFDVFGLRGGKPETVVEKFAEAYSKFDAKEIMECMAPEVRNEASATGIGGSVDEIQQAFDMIKGFGATITDITIGKAEMIDVDKAKSEIKSITGIDVEAKEAAKVNCSFNMHLELMGETMDEPVNLQCLVVKQGGKWYIACADESGSENPPYGDGMDNTEAATEDITEAVTETATDDATEAVTEASTEAASTDTTEASTQAPAFTGDGLDATLWLWGFDKNTWIYNEDKFTDKEKQSSLTIRIPKDDDADKDRVSINVEAKITDTYQFREDLYKCGIDEHDYVDGKVPTEKIGGVDFIKNTDQGGNLQYISRIEGANETIVIKVRGEVEDAAVKTALENISFKVTDIGNTDGPWYWEGTPFTTDDMSATIGSFTIDSHFMKMAEPLVTHETFYHSVAYANNCVYILQGKTIRKFNIGETGLELAGEYQLDKDYKRIISTDDGRLFLSGYSKGFVEWKDGEIVKEYSGSGTNVYMDPTGTFGVSDYSKGESVNKVTLSGDELVSTPMPLAEVGSIANMVVSKDHIIACGSSSDENEKGHKIFVYDTDGNYQFTLESPDENHGLGSVTYVFDTANGFMAMDGNMRTIVFWDNNGTPIGQLEDSDLFGTDYPWFADSVMTPEGNLLTVMTEERDDKSAKEVLVYMMKGF